MLNDKYLMERYEVGDIISYEDLFYALGDGYGDPGCADIATLEKHGRFPLGFAERDEENVLFEDRVFTKETYGETWVCVCNGGELDWREAADIGQAYLLDVCSSESLNAKLLQEEFSRKAKEENVLSAIEDIMARKQDGSYLFGKETLALAYSSGMIPEESIMKWYDYECLVYRGMPIFIDPDDMHPDRPNIRNLNGRASIPELKDPKIKKWVENKVKEAIEEGKQLAKMYENWESSWIGGPQW